MIAIPVAADWAPLVRGPGRIATPRSASMPLLLTIRSGSAFINEVSRRSRVPPIISGFASIASRTIVRAGASEARVSFGRIALGSASRAYARATSRSGKA